MLIVLTIKLTFAKSVSFRNATKKENMKLHYLGLMFFNEKFLSFQLNKFNDALPSLF